MSGGTGVLAGGLLDERGDGVGLGPMRLPEKVAQQLQLGHKHIGRIMEDHAFLCVYASTRNPSTRMTACHSHLIGVSRIRSSEATRLSDECRKACSNAGPARTRKAERTAADAALGAPG